MFSSAVFFLSLFVLPLTTDLAIADYVVIESNVEKIKKDQTIRDAEKITIPKGGEIKVLDKTSNANLKVQGPYEGTIKAYKPKKVSIWDKIENMVTGSTEQEEIGGSRGTIEQDVPGGTRGVKRIEGDKKEDKSTPSSQK